jgi:CRISPR-associated protein Csm3
LTGDFDKLTFRALIEGELENLTPLSIGSGEIGKLGNLDNPVITANINGKPVPYIPGSTLKGVLRTEAEKIARTRGLTVCNVFDHESSCNKAKQDADLCVICRTFGSQAITSHVKIMDAYPTTADYSLSVEPGVAIDRVTGAARPHSKYDVQVINPSARFKFRIIVENIDFRDAKDERAKIILDLVKKLENGQIQIGGKCSVGHGLVKLHAPLINWTGEEQLKRGESYTSQSLASFLGEKTA